MKLFIKDIGFDIYGGSKIKKESPEDETQKETSDSKKAADKEKVEKRKKSKKKKEKLISVKPEDTIKIEENSVESLSCFKYQKYDHLLLKYHVPWYKQVSCLTSRSVL